MTVYPRSGKQGDTWRERRRGAHVHKRESTAEIKAVAEEFGFEAAALIAVAEVESGGRVFAEDRRQAGTGDPFRGPLFRPAPIERVASAGSRRRPGVAAGGCHRQSFNARRALGRCSSAPLNSISAGRLRIRIVGPRPGDGRALGLAWFCRCRSAGCGGTRGRGGASSPDGALHREGRSRHRHSEKHDWAAFARGYNGPGYRRFSYHLKIAAAYKRLVRGKSTRKTANAGRSLLGNCAKARAATTSAICNGACQRLAMPSRMGRPLWQRPPSRRWKQFPDADTGWRSMGIAGPKTRAAIRNPPCHSGRARQGVWAIAARLAGAAVSQRVTEAMALIQTLAPPARLPFVDFRRPLC